MNDLLAYAIDAHGGLDRWQGFTRLSTELSVGGAIWEIKRQPGLLTDKVFAIETKLELSQSHPSAAPRRISCSCRAASRSRPRRAK